MIVCNFIFLVNYKMVSPGPSHEEMNFTYMFDMPDLRGPLPEIKYNKDSIMSKLNDNADYSKFKYIIKLANLDGIYSDIQANFTLFVPSDKALSHINDNVFINMDLLTARNIIRSSTLKRRITGAILEDSPRSWFHTLDPRNRLLVTNNNGETFLNNNIKVIHTNISASNGMIHVIDNLLWPQFM